VPKAATMRKPPYSIAGNSAKQMAAGEFKAKCLGLIDDVSETGHEVIITKRGEPKAKLVPFGVPAKKKPFLGRLVGLMEIVGDPDDLIKPVFPLEDYDMLK
jgi:prevent-host-death family protein